jgi:hypothetical protein
MIASHPLKLVVTATAAATTSHLDLDMLDPRIFLAYPPFASEREVSIALTLRAGSISGSPLNVVSRTRRSRAEYFELPK